jgi:hypothetical protein
LNWQQGIVVVAMPIAFIVSAASALTGTCWVACAISINFTRLHYKNHIPHCPDVVQRIPFYGYQIRLETRRDCPDFRV